MRKCIKPVTFFSCAHRIDPYQLSKPVNVSAGEKDLARAICSAARPPLMPPGAEVSAKWQVVVGFRTGL